MKMTGEERIAAPIEAVWSALNDPDVLRASIPGCQSLEPDGDNGFRAAVTIKVGPISARFGGAVQLFDLNPPRSYTISGEGSGGAAGSAKGKAHVLLIEDGDGTLLQYDVSADVNGRLAQLGGKLIDVTAKQLAGVFFTRFGNEVVKRQAESGTGTDRVSRPQAIAGNAASPPPPPASPVYQPQAATTSTPITVWLLLVLAALTVGFILGRTSLGWDGTGALAGAAIGLLIVQVGAMALLLGQRMARPQAAVSLEPETIARLAAALSGQQK